MSGEGGNKYIDSVDDTRVIVIVIIIVVVRWCHGRISDGYARHRYSS